jgi:hypothetical protein
MEEAKGRARGGKARALSLTPEQRQEISGKGVLAKRELAGLPKATHGSAEHPLKIGDIEIPCYVLEDGRRVLSQRGLQTGIGMSAGGGTSGEQRLAQFSTMIANKSLDNKELSVRGIDLAEKLRNPIKFNAGGGKPAYGYEATVLADLCDLVLEARTAGVLHNQQKHLAAQAEILVRGFARVGIIALVDEATGYQKDRAKDALAKILEAFVAKELQPWIKTFPTEYYEHLFRIYGYDFPPKDKRPQWRPAFFGRITNEVVYNRLAPDLSSELKKAASKAEKKAKLHQWLTKDRGHPKLREHLASLVTLLKLSNTPEEWRKLVDKIHPRYVATSQLSFIFDEDEPTEPLLLP